MEVDGQIKGGINDNSGHKDGVGGKQQESDE